MKHSIAIAILALGFAVVANAQSCTQNCVLPYYGVNLTWNAPISSPDPVAAYEVFRAPSGSTSFVSLSGGASTTSLLTYADKTVLPVTTYNYIVESVDAQGVLSVPSNVASVTVPALLPIGTLIGHTT